jgi:CRISPR-associated protein Csb1
MNVLNLLSTAPRLLYEVQLRPAQSNRFQPTGFANLGAAEYEFFKDGNRVKALLVESSQSMANRLEKTCLAGDGPHLDPELDGIPYVVARLVGLDDEIVTSSLVEAHRIASPYFLHNKDFAKLLEKAFKYKANAPLTWGPIYSTLFRYDPNALLHGVFLSLLGDGRVRCPRAISAFIEAEDVEKVLSGGVKNSPVDPSGSIQTEGSEGEKGVYSNVPYARIEYTASSITAYFNLDLSLIRSYGLGDNATRFLILLALLKVRRLLDSSLRLRTACDFLPLTSTSNVPDFKLPDQKELLSALKTAISDCASLFANPAQTVIETKVVKKSKDKTIATDAPQKGLDEEADQDTEQSQ